MSKGHPLNPVISLSIANSETPDGVCPLGWSNVKVIAPPWSILDLALSLQDIHGVEKQI